MKTITCSLIIFILAITIFSSCQKEIDWTPQNRATGNDSVVRQMMKIVETDVFGGGDSTIRNFKTITQGGLRTVIMTETFSWFPGDTLYSKFVYDAQDRLVNIYVTESLYPGDMLAKYTVTWNAGRIQRVSCDTSGAFSESYDFTYINAGANTRINSNRIPAWHPNDPQFTYDQKFSLVVNNSFLPVNPIYTDRLLVDYGGGHIDRFNDTTSVVNNFSGTNLMTSTYNYSAHDTTDGGAGQLIQTKTDTTTYTYARASAGTNLADSIKKIISPELFAMGNFYLFRFDRVSDILGLLTFDSYGYLYTAPYNTIHITKKYYKNAVFLPGNSYTNLLFKRIDNTVDAAGRLTAIDVYEDFNPAPALQTKFRIYYY